MINKNHKTTHKNHKNSVEIALAPETTTPVSTNDTASIGNRIIVTTNYAYAGLISNSMIYNRALTAQEVQQNFYASSSRYAI